MLLPASYQYVCALLRSGRLTHAINTRGKQLVLRLNEVCDGKQRTLSEKKDALEQLAAITDHCVDFVSAALQQVYFCFGT